MESKSKQDEPAFFDDIKLKLLSNKTINFIGNNNNIPDNYFDNYYVKAKLISYGNNPHAICLGKGKENKPSTGKIHYPMEKYYIKLTLRKGQFDGVYSTKKEFELSNFECEIVYKTFDKISESSIILFEFKNGNSDWKKVISQALNYQENAAFLLKGLKFYHIIILRSEELKKGVLNLMESIKEKNMINFAILCLDNKLEICGKKFSNVEIEKSERSKEGTKTSKKTVYSKVTSFDSEARQFFKYYFDELKNSINELKEEIIKIKKDIK